MHTLGQLSIRSGIPVQKLRRWIQSGYITGYKRFTHSNGKIGYQFSDRHLNDVLRVKGLRMLGFALGVSWIIVSRENNDLQNLIKSEE